MMFRTLYKLAGLSLFVLAPISTSATDVIPGPIWATVVSVYDGDTS